MSSASGPDAVERQTLRGRTPLFLAVELGLVENASILLQRGAQPDTQDHEQDSPLLVGRLHTEHDLLSNAALSLILLMLY